MTYYIRNTIDYRNSRFVYMTFAIKANKPTEAIVEMVLAEFVPCKVPIIATVPRGRSLSN
jgi:hypothetical protein